MKAILVFIDGTICDAHQRYPLGVGTPEFYRREEMLKDAAVPGSVQCLQELAQRYQLVYIGARPVSTLPYTEEWLARSGFPSGPYNTFLLRTKDILLDMLTDSGTNRCAITSWP